MWPQTASVGCVEFEGCPSIGTLATSFPASSDLEAPILSGIRRQFGGNDRGRRLGIVESCEALALIILQHAGAVADVEKVPQSRFASVASNNKGSG
jgi:hypothetical protein